MNERRRARRPQGSSRHGRPAAPHFAEFHVTASSVTAPSHLAADAFRGQTLVVTGASRGLGRACALAAAAAGGHIVAVARTQGGLEALDDDVRAAGATPPVLVPADVTDGEALDRLGAALYERFGAVHGLIHAAGGHQGLAPLAHVAPKAFDAVIALNLTSAYRLLRAFDPLLRAGAAARGRATAVVIDDATPPDPPVFWAPYAAAKAGLAALARAYDAESAPNHVRARVFTPPPMATRVRMKAFPGDMGAVAGAGASSAGAALAEPQAIAADVLQLFVMD